MSGSGPSKHIRHLQRRADWLQERIATCGFDNTYDKAEMAAILWAIENLKHLKGMIAHRVKEEQV